PGWVKIALYAVIVLALCIGLQRVARRTRRDSEVAEHSIAMLALGAGAVAAILIYLAYYWLVGPSYQQWKLALSTVGPLAFVAPALMAKSLRSADPFGKIGAQTIGAQAVMAIVLICNLGLSARHLSPQWTAFESYDSLSKLQQVVAERRPNRVAVDFGDAWTPTMVALQFVEGVPLDLYSPSYFGPGLGSARSQPGTLIVSDCDGLAAGGKMELGANFCVGTDTVE
ncbi:hypothetical protein GP486_008739, partial [Trichoglossum hirsutum]